MTLRTSTTLAARANAIRPRPPTPPRHQRRRHSNSDTGAYTNADGYGYRHGDTGAYTNTNASTDANAASYPNLRANTSWDGQLVATGRQWC